MSLVIDRLMIHYIRSEDSFLGALCYRRIKKVAKFGLNIASKTVSIHIKENCADLYGRGRAYSIESLYRWFEDSSPPRYYSYHYRCDRFLRCRMRSWIKRSPIASRLLDHPPISSRADCPPRVSASLDSIKDHLPGNYAKRRDDRDV